MSLGLGLFTSRWYLLLGSPMTMDRSWASYHLLQNMLLQRPSPGAQEDKHESPVSIKKTFQHALLTIFKLMTFREQSKFAQCCGTQCSAGHLHCWAVQLWMKRVARTHSMHAAWNEESSTADKTFHSHYIFLYCNKLPKEIFLNRIHSREFIQISCDQFLSWWNFSLNYHSDVLCCACGSKVLWRSSSMWRTDTILNTVQWTVSE